MPLDISAVVIMPATDTMPETTDPEDREIVETLAKLQSMSNQVSLAQKYSIPQCLAEHVADHRFADFVAREIDQSDKIRS